MSQPDDQTIEQVLSQAYYRGKDSKGYSEYEMNSDIAAITAHFIACLPEKNPTHGNFNECDHCSEVTLSDELCDCLGNVTWGQAIDQTLANFKRGEK